MSCTNQAGAAGDIPPDQRACWQAWAAAAGFPADHLATCGDCRRHAAAARALGGLLAQRPPLPGALSAADALERIHERCIEEWQAGPAGKQLVGALSARSPSPAFDVPALSSAQLVRLAAVRPPMPSVDQWQQVASRVRAAVHAIPNPRRPWLPLAITALTAVAILCVFLVSDGTTSDTPIVFADLETMPQSEFAMVRYGLLR
jgi:hypothetical protein